MHFSLFLLVSLLGTVLRALPLDSEVAGRYYGHEDANRILARDLIQGRLDTVQRDPADSRLPGHGYQTILDQDQPMPAYWSAGHLQSWAYNYWKSMIWTASRNGAVPVGPTLVVNRQGVPTALTGDAQDWIRHQMTEAQAPQILLPVVRSWEDSTGVLHGTFLLLNPRGEDRTRWTIRSIDPIAAFHHPFPVRYKNQVRATVLASLPPRTRLSWVDSTMPPENLPQTEVVNDGIEMLLTYPPEGEHSYQMWCAALSSLLTSTMVDTGHAQYEVNYALAAMEREPFMDGLRNYVEDSVHNYLSTRSAWNGHDPVGPADYIPARQSKRNIGMSRRPYLNTALSRL